jgi:hypothetical protein
VTEMNKKLRKYVTDLLKYSENSGVFNPNFYTHQIPEIFSGWSEIEFNMVHHGVGEGCCTIIGAGRYKINISHCNRLHNEFMKEEKEEDDAMMRAFHGVPLAHRLETMPDIDLAELQSRLATNSPGTIIIENEWQRRKLSKMPSTDLKKTNKSITTIQKIKHWYQGNEVELIPIKNGNFVDVYARYEKSTSARVANGLVKFWFTHWKILLPVIVSVIGIIVAAGVSLYIHFDSKPKGEPTQKSRETPKQMRTDISQPLIIHNQSSLSRPVTRPQK